MRKLILTLLVSSLAFSELNHKGSSLLRPEIPTRAISNLEEAQKTIEASEKENGEWSAVSCAKEGCTYQRFVNGQVLEEVFIPATLKDKTKPKSIGEAQSHESEYPSLNSTAEYEEALKTAKAQGIRYLLVKFGAPNHNCLSCLRFDKFVASPAMKKFLSEKKVEVYTTDVGEFTNPAHAELAKKLGAQVANQSFHIPYAAVVDLQDPALRPQPLINGYFGGVSSEREQLREMKRIERVIK